MEVKYGGRWVHWCFAEVRNSNGLGVWEYIRSGWDEFSIYVKLYVLDGSGVIGLLGRIVW